MIEIRLFRCICGAAFIGTEANYDQHLQSDCPVFAEALRILEVKRMTKAI